MIYLDNAATTWPKPEIVYRTMDTFMRNSGGNPGRGGHSMAESASKVVDDTRLLLARLINAPDNNRVIFTLNCTDSLNTGLKGLLKPGDHVITSTIEHNSVIRPLEKLRYQGIGITRVSTDPEHGYVLPEDIEKAITGKTKLIVMTHASNVNGVIQPVSEYGSLARKYNLILMIDAAQSVGKYAVDVQRDNIDLLAFSGHKGLFGPAGTGGLYIGERAELDTLREGGTGSQSELEEQPSMLPYKYESGTANTVGIAGLGAGLRYIFEESTNKILEHELHLTSRIIEGLSGIPGITIYAARNISHQCPVVSFTVNDTEPGEVGTILDQAFDIKVRTGLHCAPAAHKTLGTLPRGTVRLSPGYFNTNEEIDVTLEAIERIAFSKGSLKKAEAGLKG
ncbi:MAG: aminotransferase class V-fold PLP-dependent enzyme [Dehalococcoidales bacterium]|nr:MAG: aminotransferase class V-fold PLP-dependent enzyme [Dehalococcoidales bacterium]